MDLRANSWAYTSDDLGLVRKSEFVCRCGSSTLRCAAEKPD